MLRSGLVTATAVALGLSVGMAHPQDITIGYITKSASKADWQMINQGARRAGRQ